MSLELGPHPITPGLYELRAATWLPRPRVEVFEFFADAFNLERITPPLLQFHVLTPPPIVMRIGALIDCRLRLRRIPLRWRTEITAWDPPHRFADEQVSGPYALWRHTHEFQQQAGGTLMTDRIEYAVPFGTLVHVLFVKNDVQRIFEFRERAMHRLLGARPTSA